MTATTNASGSETAVLSLDGVSKNFGALRATDDVSLAVLPRTCHALIGPNGAGKTTLIHQISGVLRPDAGAIHFDGDDITRLSVAARARAGLSRTFQITAVIPSFSALANVALAAQATAGSSFRFLRPVASEDALNARAHACLESVGLASRATAPASDLSHGARRLLELAMALATTPKLLLLDEPMAGLGRAESRDVIDVLATLRRDVAMLLVEHDMDAVFALADEVSVLVSGSIVTTGTPAAVRADRQARAAYLGDDTMAADVHGEIAP